MKVFQLHKAVIQNMSNIQALSEWERIAAIFDVNAISWKWRFQFLYSDQREI